MPAVKPAPPRPRGTSPSPRAAAHVPFQLPGIVAFYVVLLVNVLAALLAPIQDCDETFNYWEPTHYLRHGFGLQTWEYSPEYAIRSWFYVGLHAIVSGIGAFMPFVNNKIDEFYFLRIVLATTCAACQARLYVTVSRVLNPRVGIMFLMAMVLSPGMFHASVAYLPSSFAMYAAMLGMASFMEWRGGLKTAQGIMWFGIAGIVGWPFAVALSSPYLLEELVLAMVSQPSLGTAAWRWLDGGLRCVIVLGLQLLVDFFFYRSPELVPFNIVKYNVFSGSSKGPDIFGTESWHFYMRNLLLNFNVWFVLALLALPLIALRSSSSAVSAQSRLRGMVFVSPFYLWLSIFSLQAHKEERFMYPAYPALGLNAAISLHMVLSAFGSADAARFVGRIRPNVKLAVVAGFGLVAIAAGVLRTVGMVTAYSAPFRVHRALQRVDLVSMDDINVCYGKEWYRFPSSFFLPRNYRAKFVKSAFDGLLPGEFSEADASFGSWPTWLVPSGMNDENREDVGKHTSLSQCTFLIDSYFPSSAHSTSTSSSSSSSSSSTSSDLEPDYVLDSSTWEKMTCHPFLDASRTGLLGRALWVPDWDIVPDRFRRKWGTYCLLQRRRRRQ